MAHAKAVALCSIVPPFKLSLTVAGCAWCGLSVSCNHACPRVDVAYPVWHVACRVCDAAHPACYPILHVTLHALHVILCNLHALFALFVLV